MRVGKQDTREKTIPPRIYKFIFLVDRKCKAHY